MFLSFRNDERKRNWEIIKLVMLPDKLTLSIFSVKAEIFLYFSYFTSLTLKAKKQECRALMLFLINQEFPVRLRATAPSIPLAVCLFLSKITISYSHSYFPSSYFNVISVSPST